MAEGLDTEQANSGPSPPVRFGETHRDAIQQSYTDLDKSGHTKVFNDVPKLCLSAPDFMRCRYASEKPTDHISSDEKKVRFILQDIGLNGTAHVLIYAMDIDKNALHPVKLVGYNCEKGVYYKTMKLQPGKKIDIKIGLLPVLPTNKEITKNIEARGKYLREMSKETFPEDSSRKGKINKNLFCLKVEVQCPNGMTLVGYSNPVRDGKDGMEFKVYKYCEDLSHTSGLVTMTKNSNFDDNIDDVVVLLKKKGSAENEKPLEVFKPLEIEKKAITIKPISAYIKERYPESEWCLFQIQVKDCVTGLKTVPHDLYGATVSSASPCTSAKKIRTEHGINKEQEYKGQPCSDQAKKAILQKMMCKSDAVKSPSVSEQVESSVDEQLTLSSNITNQPPKCHPGMQNIPTFHHQADLRSSASQMEASAGSLKALSAVKKRKVIQKGIEEKREHVDIKQDKICTSVAGHPNNADIIPVSDTSKAIRHNMVQAENLLVTDCSASSVCGRDTSSWDLELMQMNGSQTHPQTQYDLEDYPVQQDTCQKPDQVMDAHDDDDVVQQDSSQKTDQTLDDQEDDAMQQDSGLKSDQPMDTHEDDAVQQDSGKDPDQAIDDEDDALQHNNGQKLDQTMDEIDVLQQNRDKNQNHVLNAHEDDVVQQDNGQNPNQATDAQEDDALQLDSGQKPDDTIDAHEDDKLQLDSGHYPHQALDGQEGDVLQLYSSQQANETLDTHEDDKMQLDRGQNPNQAIDAHEDNALQLDRGQNPNHSIDAHEDDALQLVSSQNPNQDIDVHKVDTVQQNSGPRPNQAFDTHEDDAIQLDSGRNPNQAIDARKDDALQLDSGQNPNQAIDIHEDDAMQLDSGENPNQAVDANEDDELQLDSGENPNQAVDAHIDDELQLDSCQNPNQTIDVHEDDAMQLNSGPKPNQGFDANEDDAVQQDDDQNQNEAGEDMQEDTMSPTEMVATINNLIQCSKVVSEDNIMDPNQKSPLSVFEEHMR